LEFLKRRRGEKAEQVADAGSTLLPEEVEAEDYELKLTYRAKSSNGVRMTAGPGVMSQLPDMLSGIARSEIEVVSPLEAESADAAPAITHPTEALAWINARHDASPITRHALMVLESLDAIDPAFETAALTMLSGRTDTSGYPEYDAILGGVVSHWDEVTGDIVVRAVVGWGGKGVRGDTERQAGKILAGMLANVLASQDAIGLTIADRPMPAAGSGGLVCAHCSFASAHDRAFYCPKCGMRMVRG
jgi:hypothetical protein